MSIDKRLVVIVCCHNRRSKTLASLEALSECTLPPAVNVRVLLVDDGSTDGTAESVRTHHPLVEIIHAAGNLYWNGAMRLGMDAAMKEHAANWILWLNDDTVLDRDALEVLVDTSTHHKAMTSRGAIVVGTTKDPVSGDATYGGVEFPYWYRRTTARLLVPRERPIEAESMNGNCVLIDRDVIAKVGNLDSAFVHSMGDYDYGLRAREAGFAVIVAPGYVGKCARNAVTGTFLDEKLGLRARLKLVVGAKGRPPYSWLVYTRRHGGWLWPLLWLWPYPRVLLSWARAAAKKRELL